MPFTRVAFVTIQRLIHRRTKRPSTKIKKMAGIASSNHCYRTTAFGVCNYSCKEEEKKKTSNAVVICMCSRPQKTRVICIVAGVRNSSFRPHTSRVSVYTWTRYQRRNVLFRCIVERAKLSSWRPLPTLVPENTSRRSLLTITSPACECVS